MERNVGPRRSRAAILTASIAVVVLLATGCKSDDQGSESVSETTAAPATTQVGRKSPAYSVKEAGLRFDLPDTFQPASNKELLFLAKSLSPRAIFSIDTGSAEDARSYEKRPGETVTPTTIGNVDALIVSNAALEGLPAGIAGNELVIDNGERSVSVIMSAEQADLDVMWDQFIGSLQVERS